MKRKMIARQTMDERLAGREKAWAVLHGPEPELSAAAAKEFEKSYQRVKAMEPHCRRALLDMGKSLHFVQLSHKQRFLELYDEIAELRATVAELRASRWRGVWSPTETYERGNLTTAGGSLFHCNANGTAEKPGTGDDWSMMTKTAR